MGLIFSSEEDFDEYGHYDEEMGDDLSKSPGEEDSDEDSYDDRPSPDLDHLSHDKHLEVEIHKVGENRDPINNIYDQSGDGNREGGEDGGEDCGRPRAGSRATMFKSSNGTVYTVSNFRSPTASDGRPDSDDDHNMAPADELLLLRQQNQALIMELVRLEGLLNQSAAPSAAATTDTPGGHHRPHARAGASSGAGGVGVTQQQCSRCSVRVVQCSGCGSRAWLGSWSGKQDGGGDEREHQTGGTVLPPPPSCLTHKGEYVLDKDAQGFLDLDAELKSNMRREKQKRLTQAAAEMAFVIDTDDPMLAPGAWACCGQKGGQARGCAANESGHAYAEQ